MLIQPQYLKGINWDVKHIYLIFSGIEYMYDFIESGYGILINEVEEITFNVNEKQNIQIADQLFQPGWEEKIKQTLEQIENI